MKLRCACGQMQGVARDIHHRRVRLTCYCRDCQTYAWFLERAELLDRHGGTQVVQLSQARVSFHAGQDQLACVRQSPKGAMRWYAGCCKTPLANSMPTPKSPFVGLVSSCWDPTLDEAVRERLLGPMRGRVNGPGHAAADGSVADIDKMPLGVIATAIRLMLGSFVRGEHRPSPFFEPNGAPKVEPRVLSLAEREALRAKLPSPASH